MKFCTHVINGTNKTSITPDNGVFSLQSAVLEKGKNCRLFLEHDGGKTLLCSLNSKSNNPVEQVELNLAVSSDEEIFVYTNNDNARVYLNGYIVDSTIMNGMNLDEEIDYDEEDAYDSDEYFEQLVKEGEIDDDIQQIGDQLQDDEDNDDHDGSDSSSSSSNSNSDSDSDSGEDSEDDDSKINRIVSSFGGEEGDKETITAYESLLQDLKRSADGDDSSDSDDSDDEMLDGRDDDEDDSDSDSDNTDDLDDEDKEFWATISGHGDDSWGALGGSEDEIDRETLWNNNDDYDDINEGEGENDRKSKKSVKKEKSKEKSKENKKDEEKGDTEVDVTFFQQHLSNTKDTADKKVKKPEGKSQNKVKLNQKSISMQKKNTKGKEKEKDTGSGKFSSFLEMGKAHMKISKKNKASSSSSSSSFSKMTATKASSGKIKTKNRR